MKRNVLRRLAALAGAVGLCLACAAPVFAEEDQWEYLEQTRVDTALNHSIITRPSATLSGQDAQDGTLLLEKGKAMKVRPIST